MIIVQAGWINTWILWVSPVLRQSCCICGDIRSTNLWFHPLVCLGPCVLGLCIILCWLVPRKQPLWSKCLQVLTDNLKSSNIEMNRMLFWSDFYSLNVFLCVVISPYLILWDNSSNFSLTKTFNPVRSARLLTHNCLGKINTRCVCKWLCCLDYSN